MQLYACYKSLLIAGHLSEIHGKGGNGQVTINNNRRRMTEIVLLIGVCSYNGWAELVGKV